MRAKWHLKTSLAIAFTSLFFSQDTPFLVIDFLGHRITVFVLCIALGFFVDIDHLADFRLNRGVFFGGTGAKGAYAIGRWFVILHGIEVAAILCGLSIAFPFLMFPVISYLCHMVMDISFNGVPIQAYFYTIRFRRIWLARHGH